MNEKEQLLAMLDRAGMGYVRRIDERPEGESILVESAEPDYRDRRFTTTFSFGSDGRLNEEGVQAYQES